MLTRIRNSQKAYREIVFIPYSKIKGKIASILKEEGYIYNYIIEGKKLYIYIKYFKGKPVIENLKIISKQSLRIYKRKHEIIKVANGLGTAIISTSKGIMTDRAARKIGIGGEIICTIF
ncbi:30S ribosomal protein S8 [Candidatus Johnevansia muelleri]|uniref:Small ribosomal subunit protein uS8 n=1 Tax=Candidatus Johnevansia muelleri TaxID=1495769 RepID=A0A078KB25_9GAMM|nr:30S ribosomal protein S8 [Candidatus Evansia muelleri]